jgi:hypothetical protein
LGGADSLILDAHKLEPPQKKINFKFLGTSGNPATDVVLHFPCLVILGRRPRISGVLTPALDWVLYKN